MIYIALLYITGFVLSLIFLQCFPGYKLKGNVYKYGMFLFIVAVSYVAYSYTPIISDDLFRYYKLIDRMRVRPISWGIFSSTYTYEPFSNLLFLITAKCTDNNAIFQTIGVVLTYGLFYLIIKKMTRLNIFRAENLYIITFFSFTMLLYVISGTRNTLATIFFALGFYCENDKKLYKSLILYLLACCTHMSLIVIVILRLFVRYLPYKKMTIIHFLILFWHYWADIILKVLEKFPQRYIRALVKKINIYLFERDQQFDNRFLLASTIFCVVLLIIYLKQCDINDEYTKFMGYLLLFTLGCSFSNVLFERFLRVVCVCSLPIIRQLVNKKWIWRNVLISCILLLDVGMFSYQIVMFISHFGMWFD